MARGFRGVKAKIGYQSVTKISSHPRDPQRCGEGVAIMVDYNQSLTPAEAIHAFESGGLGLTWVEEPTLSHDHEGHAMIPGASIRDSRRRELVGPAG